MLTRTGPYNETALVDAARGYLHLYADGKVPYMDEGVQAFVVFVFVNGQWVFVEVLRS
jgi:hypothetical protein